MYIENPKKAAEATIKSMEALFPYFPMVARIVRRWDGKVYNKRFNEEIRTETDCNILCSYGHYSGDSIDCSGKINGSYNDCMRFFYIHKKDLPDGKRIDAPAIILEMKKNLTRYYNEVQEIRAALATIETDKAEIERLRDEARIKASAIPSRIRDYYKINLYKY